MTKPSKQRPMPEGIWRALDLPRQWTNHSFRGDMSQVTDAHRKQLAEVVSAIWKLDGASLEKRGVPRPGVRISAETNPENAFANSVQRQIIFGTGLATRLDESAKAGIVAHELGHLRDTDRLLADGANIDHEARWLLSGKVADGSFAVGALLPALVAQLDRSEKRRKQERIADGYAGRVMAIARENGKRWSPRSWFRNVFRSNQPWTPVSEYDSASERWRQFRSTYLRSQKRLQRVKHAPSKGHL